MAPPDAAQLAPALVAPRAPGTRRGMEPGPVAALVGADSPSTRYAPGMIESGFRILAGTPAGGGQDRAARAVADNLQRTVDVINRPGRGGSDAWDALHAAAGDVSLAAVSSASLITNRMLGVAEIDDRDLTPLAQLYVEYLAFVVSADTPGMTAAELRDRCASGAVTVAIAVARGNLNHMALGAVVSDGGGDPTSLDLRVFDSALKAVADVVAGRADVAVVSVASVVPALQSGQIRVEAITSPARLGAPFDGVSTWRESGSDIVFGTWRGLVGPPGIDTAAVDRWTQLVEEAVAAPGWRDVLDTHHWTDTVCGPTDATAFLSEQRTVLGNALFRLGLIDG